MVFAFSWVTSLLYAFSNFFGLTAPPVYDAIVVGYVVYVCSIWILISLSKAAGSSLSRRVVRANQMIWLTPVVYVFAILLNPLLVRQSWVRLSFVVHKQATSISKLLFSIVRCLD